MAGSAFKAGKRGNNKILVNHAEAKPTMENTAICLKPGNGVKLKNT